MKTKLKIALLCLVIGSFELGLADFKCSDQFFDCGNGKCIANFFHCDGDNDCGNYADEMHCGDEHGVNITSAASKPCPAEHFACEDEFGTCIPNRWVCDGMTECSNGRDEMNCTADKVDCGGDFKCGNLECVPMIWRCDGIFDCTDDTDELNCTEVKRPPSAHCDPEHGMFQCMSGDCIPYSMVCNGISECASGDDEGSVCHHKACHDKKCSDLCMVDLQTNSSTCYCSPGFQLKNNTCVDADECEDNRLTNVCSQQCLNLHGSYKCLCFDDYELHNSTCMVKGESPILLLSTGVDVRAYNRDTHQIWPLVEARNMDIIVTLDFFIKHKKLYYSTLTNESHSIVYEVSFDPTHAGNLATNQKQIYQDTNSQIEGIAVDWLAGHLYLTESNKNRIIVCNIDRLVCGTLINNLKSPRGIVVIPQEGKMYWTQWGDNHHRGIYQAHMDGSNVSLMISDVEWPNDLAYDEAMNRLYWCDGKSGIIKYYDFELKHIFLVFEDHLRQPYSMFVFEDTLYWSDWTYQELVMCNKIHCHLNHHPQFQYNGAHGRGFFGTTIYHPVLQKSKSKTYNPCEFNKCSHMCLISGPNAYSCHCPDHSVLTSDNKTCVAKNDTSYLVVSTGYQLYKFYPDSPSAAFEEITMPEIMIGDLALNLERQEIYIHDNYHNRLGVLNLKAEVFKRWSILVDIDLDAIMGLAYEQNADVIYWTDMIKGTLEVVHITSRNRATLNSDLRKPISLTVSALTKTIFVGQRGNLHPEIIQLTLDGTLIKKLLTAKVGFPFALATYLNSTELIWGDPIVQKIDFVKLNNPDGPKPRGLIANHVNTITSLTIHNDTLYWTNSESSFLFSMGLEQNNHSVFRKRVPISPRGIDNDMFRVVSAVFQPRLYLECEPGQHHCAHLCLIGNQGPTCKCSDGYSTKNNGLTCTLEPKSKSKQQSSHLPDFSRFFEFILSKQHETSDDSWSFFSPIPPVPFTPVEHKRPSNTPMLETVTEVVKSNALPVENTRDERSGSTVALNWLVGIMVVSVIAFFAFKKRHQQAAMFRDIVERIQTTRDTNSKQIRFFANPNYNPSTINEKHYVNNEVIVDNSL